MSLGVTPAGSTQPGAALHGPEVQGAQGLARPRGGTPLTPCLCPTLSGCGFYLPQAMKVLSKKKLIRQAGFPRECGVGCTGQGWPYCPCRGCPGNPTPGIL